MPLIQGVSSAVPGGLPEGCLLLSVSVLMALHAVAMAPDAEYSQSWCVIGSRVTAYEQISLFGAGL